jgi:hypothetical protein
VVKVIFAATAHLEDFVNVVAVNIGGGDRALAVAFLDEAGPGIVELRRLAANGLCAANRWGQIGSSCILRFELRTQPSEYRKLREGTVERLETSRNRPTSLEAIENDASQGVLL